MYEPHELPMPSPNGEKRMKHSQSIKDPNRPKRPNKSHYLAAKMGLDTSKRARRFKSRSPSPELQEIPSFRMNLDYEHRTVNSIADDSEFGDNAPLRKKKSRKPEYIDSEVDLMRTRKTRPPINMSRLLNRHQLQVIDEHISDIGLVKAPKNRRKKLKKLSAPTSPTLASTKAEDMKSTSSKFKKISPTPPSSPASGSSNLSDKYPVLKDQDLVNRFLKVEFTNNQKGRIRQVVKDILRGTSSTLMPEVINNKIQAILKSSASLTDTDLRKIRVLYNMLKKATEDLNKRSETTDSEEFFKDQCKESNNKEDYKRKETKSKEGKTIKEDKPKKKVKQALGIKRYVVFVGNLPLNVTKEQILNHFAEIRNFVRDVRIPPSEDKKSSYAYVEFDNAPIYEMALSKHHSMMGSKRINVLYTTPNKKSKISKSEAKAKSAKLLAMAKKGTLIGSIPLERKRSHRRAKARAFQRAAENQAISKK